MELRNQTILITGGAGFIGSHLAERLAPANRIRVVDDFSTGSRENLRSLAARDNVEIIDGDVSDKSTAGEWCRGADIVFHLAVSCLRTSLNHPQRSHAVNAGGTLNLCMAAVAQSVQRLVYVSSSEVYGSARQTPMAETHPTRPLTVYGAAKLAGELYALACHRTYGLPVVVVRPFNTYGPREPWEGTRGEVIPRLILRSLSDRPAVIFGDGRQTRDFTFVDDTVSGIILAAECDALIGDVVNIATGRETSIRQIAALVAEKLGCMQAPIMAEARPGDVQRHLADISKAAALLGYRPRIDVDVGVGRCIDWFASNIPDPAICVEPAGQINW